MSRKEGQSLVLRIVTDPIRMNFQGGLLRLQSSEEIFWQYCRVGGRRQFEG